MRFGRKTELVIGKQVKHRAFGNGTIVNIGTDTIHIQFDAGEKILSFGTCLEMGLLEPLDD